MVCQPRLHTALRSGTFALVTAAVLLLFPLLPAMSFAQQNERRLANPTEEQHRLNGAARPPPPTSTHLLRRVARSSIQTRTRPIQPIAGDEIPRASWAPPSRHHALRPGAGRTDDSRRQRRVAEGLAELQPHKCDRHRRPDRLLGQQRQVSSRRIGPRHCHASTGCVSQPIDYRRRTIEE